MAYTSISVDLRPGDAVAVTDRQHPDRPDLRVVTLSWGPLTVHLGGQDDRGVAESALHLVLAAEVIRAAALERDLLRRESTPNVEPVTAREAENMLRAVFGDR